MPIGIGGAGASVQFQDEFHMMAAPFYPVDDDNPEVYAPGNKVMKDSQIERSPEEQQDRKQMLGVDATPMRVSDTSDYDYKGWQEANPDVRMSPGQHYPDTWKLPNHITFSNDSKYSNDETPGGKWEQGDDKAWTFTPSDHNLQQNSPSVLKDYFSKYEKGDPENGIPASKLNLDTAQGLAAEASEKARDALERAKGNIDKESIGDWLFGSKSTKTTQTNAGPLDNYPSQGDAKNAIEQGFGYGTGNEPYIESKVMQKAPPNTMNLEQLTSGNNTSVDLTKLKNIDELRKVNTLQAQAALAVNRSAIATLGYKPDKMAVSTNMRATDVRGATDRDTGNMWVNANDEGLPRSTPVHESIHAGLQELKKNDEAKALIKAMPNEESIVRYIMSTKMGNPEQGSGDLADQQREAAHAAFTPTQIKRLELLESIAADLHAKKRTGGR